jgi:hypothetical protein
MGYQQQRAEFVVLAQGSHSLTGIHAAAIRVFGRVPGIHSSLPACLSLWAVVPSTHAHQ